MARGPQIRLRICVDVGDLEAAIRFYRQALGLKVAHRRSAGWVELSGASAPIDLLAKPSGSMPHPAAHVLRAYARHWTPVHLDFIVADVAAAVQRALSAGATLESGPTTHDWGLMANLADPFGHGFCLIALTGRAYDETVDIEENSTEAAI
ncbi:MAG: VOC family protein [Gammaproteobacteria bacterium]